jgi:hypothetical protein
MADTIIDRLHYELSSLLTVLEKAQEISLRSTADDTWRKSLLLAAASHFERRMTESVLAFVSGEASGNSLVTSFVKNKAVSRQYHTWFSWDQTNANSFFGLFGDEFRMFMKGKVKGDVDLAESIKAFLELGAHRNRLVHQDYGTFWLEKTAEEIYGLYKKALRFVDEFPGELTKYSREQQQA